MATCAEVIRSAFRRSGVAAAAVTLSAANQQIGLERLQGMYIEWVGSGLFGKFCDYYLTSGDYTAKEFQRIFKADDASVVTIPDTVTDACTGLTRAPLDGACIVVVDPNTSETQTEPETDAGFEAGIHLYDALKGWSTLNDLEVTDYAPLSGRFEEGIKSLLAVALCDEYGYSIPPKLARDAGMAKLRIVSRNDRPRKPSRVEYY
jgi:hypothetical protein